MAFKPTIGLDIGSQQIKVVELRPGKNGRLAVTAVGVTPTPVGVMQNNIITDPQIMGQAIRQLLRESGITTKRVVGSVTGQSAVVIRIIEVPRMTDAELKETMRWEVERHVPFAPSETIIDYQPLTPTDAIAASSPNMEVLLAVAQQDIISNYIDAVFAAGLDPAAIDIEPLAVARASLDLVDGRPVVRNMVAPPPVMDASGAGMSQSGFGQQETVAIVNIGAANTDISIFQNGQLAFPRSLPLAGDSLTRAIADLLGYPMEQAERIKRDHGTIQLDRMAVYTGTYYGDEPSFDGPQFTDEDLSSFRMGAPSSRLRGPVGEEGENPFDLGQTAQFDDAERTQPIPNTVLNLAKPATPGEGLPFVPPTDAGFSTPASSADDENLRNQVFEAIAPVLGELSTELRRSLDYYRSRAQGRSVDRVLLVGGSAALGNLEAFLQRELQVPVAVGDPLASLDVTAKHYDPQYLRLIAPAFAVALGLAARDAVFDANPLPRAAKPPRPSKRSKTGSVSVGEPTNPPVS